MTDLERYQWIKRQKKTLCYAQKESNGFMKMAQSFTLLIVYQSTGLAFMA